MEGVANRFGTNIYPVFNGLYETEQAFNRLLLALAERPLSEKDILDTSGLSRSQMEPLISKLDSIKMIRRDDRNRWALTVPVITDARMQSIRNDLIPMADGVVQYLKDETVQLKALYDRLKSSQDPAWEDVAHLVLDKFLVDGYFHRSIGDLERKHGIKEFYNQAQKHLPAFFLERGKNFSTFGVNWYPFPGESEQREVYVLHGAVMDRYNIPMNRFRDNEEFSSAIFALAPGGGIHSLTDKDKEILEELGWIEGDRLLVPVVAGDTIRALFPSCELIGRRAAEVAFESHSLIIDSFNDSPYSEFMEGSGDFIQVCYHTLFCLIIERLVDGGVLPQIPKPVPEYFGVFFVFGKVF
jgi:hypothetical protein